MFTTILQVKTKIIEFVRKKPVKIELVAVLEKGSHSITIWPVMAVNVLRKVKYFQRGPFRDKAEVTKHVVIEICQELYHGVVIDQLKMNFYLQKTLL